MPVAASTAVETLAAVGKAISRLLLAADIVAGESADTVISSKTVDGADGGGDGGGENGNEHSSTASICSHPEAVV